jgi:PAS domain S-box-containing protein
MRVRLSMHDTREALRDARFRTFEAATAALAAAIAAGLFGSASVARAVGAIKDATARIGSGDLAARTGLVRTDEIGDVARAVDAMAARLASSRARLQAALDGLPHAVLLLARDGEHAIEYANPAFERITGHARQDAIGRAPGAFVVRLEPSAFEGLRTGEPRSRRGGDRRKDGSRYEQEATLAQIRDERGEPGDFVAMVRDVTKEVELENQLRQAQKMEAVGRLAGGVAHDFNNLLTAIIGYSESLLGEGGHDEPTRESISEIRDAGKRAASLTSQLLAFSRKQVLQPKTLDLNALILQMSKMLRRLIGEDVALATDLAPALAPVRVDPGQIEQIVMNLAVNARDAMPSGGRLAISTRDVVLDDASAAAHEGARPGPHVLLEVADTGEGISDDVRAHLFEPFFTTKEPGKGTGLGLSTVYGIVRQSGGAIEVASDVGKGTTFRIYLPRTAGEAAAPAERTAAKIAASGKETVLVVEDEDVVRRLATLALRSAGFEVIDARGGPEAIAAFERAERVDLVLTDVVMPGMPGRELADRLLARRPGLPVLFMSGYTDDAVTRGGELREGTVLLQKPFTPGALVGKVREVLANGGGRAPA